MPPLKELAATRGLEVGFQINTGGVLNRPYKTGWMARHGGVAVDGNSQNMYAVQPSQGVFTYANAEIVLQWMEANNIECIQGGHLVWENEPAWMTAITNPTTLRTVMETHVETVLDYFGSRVKQWNVTNENMQPLVWGGPANGFRPNHWYNVLGVDYLEWAFKAAQDAAAPGVELIWNLAWLEWDAAASMRVKVLEKLDELLDKGCRIDGMGLQAHLRPGAQTTGNATADFMNQVAERGLNLYITELDVIDQELLLATRVQDCATLFRNMMTPIIRDVPALKHVVFWDTDDVNSWITQFYPRADGQPHRGGNLLGRDLGPNPLYQEFVDALTARPLA